MSLAAPVLVVSRLGDGALQHVIAEQIGVHPAALVRTLDLAEEGGLLERRTVPGNRRLRAIYLLPEGRRLAVKMEHALTTLRMTLLKDISKSEIDTAARVLQVLEERARHYAEQERSST
jgi:MarR family transcriptional regulator for hemolysin